MVRMDRSWTPTRTSLVLSPGSPTTTLRRSPPRPLDSRSRRIGPAWRPSGTRCWRPARERPRGGRARTPALPDRHAAAEGHPIAGPDAVDDVHVAAPVDDRPAVPRGAGRRGEGVRL